MQLSGELSYRFILPEHTLCVDIYDTFVYTMHEIEVMFMTKSNKIRLLKL